MKPTIDNPLERLDTDALQVALGASDVLMRHKRFMPRGGLLLMLVSRFRDDVGELLDVAPVGFPESGNAFCSLDELTSAELGTVAGAVDILLQARFTAVMDDPELPRQLRHFQGQLDARRQGRAAAQGAAEPRCADPDIQVSEGEGEETITVSAPGAITGTRETGIQITRMRITPDGPVMRYLLGSFGGGRVIPLRSSTP